ncbi:aldehyde dehydrogenase (NADP(+)) [Microbacterium sp. USHLN186]|uniref:aldehyde dehydrogenase (NADP(+)) n=1 Tax=Microbacterium sp. USHLN186 TaxID=3081286 RepID=UPI00301645F9
MGGVTSVDPRTGSVVETVAEATAVEETARISARAVEASRELRAMTPAERGALLDGLADRLEHERSHLVDLADRESALGQIRLDGELTRTTNQLRLFAAVLRDGAFAEVTIDHAADGSPDLRRMLVGLGPVAVFGASNFPFAFSAAGGDTASALAAGCAVIVKAHGAHPALDAAVVELLRVACSEAGVSPDAVSVVFGREAGTAIVADPLVQAVGFTGSQGAGRLLMDIAAGRDQPIPVYAEMGSLNPLVVSPGAAYRGAELAGRIASSVLLGGGQFCTKPGLVFIPDGEEGDGLLSQLSEQLAEPEGVFLLSAAIRDSFVSRVQAVASVGGVTTLVEPRSGAGSFASAALNSVSVDDLLGNPALTEECFGPAALVVRFSSADALSAAIRALPASLTISVFAEETEAAFVQAMLEVADGGAGRVIFGDVSTGVAVNWAQQHGGPYPASSSSLHTSVGAAAIRRFLRPMAFQSFPDALLPEALQDANPLNLPRRVDGMRETEIS